MISQHLERFGTTVVLPRSHDAHRPTSQSATKPSMSSHLRKAVPSGISIPSVTPVTYLPPRSPVSTRSSPPGSPGLRFHDLSRSQPPSRWKAAADTEYNSPTSSLWTTSWLSADSSIGIYIDDSTSGLPATQSVSITLDRLAENDLPRTFSRGTTWSPGKPTTGDPYLDYFNCAYDGGPTESDVKTPLSPTSPKLASPSSSFYPSSATESLSRRLGPNPPKSPSGSCQSYSMQLSSPRNRVKEQPPPSPHQSPHAPSKMVSSTSHDIRRSSWEPPPRPSSPRGATKKVPLKADSNSKPDHQQTNGQLSNVRLAVHPGIRTATSVKRQTKLSHSTSSVPVTKTKAKSPRPAQPPVSRRTPVNTGSTTVKRVIGKLVAETESLVSEVPQIEKDEDFMDDMTLAAMCAAALMAAIVEAAALQSSIHDEQGSLPSRSPSSSSDQPTISNPLSSEGSFIVRREETLWDARGRGGLAVTLKLDPRQCCLDTDRRFSSCSTDRCHLGVDEGVTLMRDPDAGTPWVRHKDASAPLMRDPEAGTPSVRQNEAGVPFMRDPDAGTPWVRRTDVGTPFVRDVTPQKSALRSPPYPQTCVIGERMHSGGTAMTSTVSQRSARLEVRFQVESSEAVPSEGQEEEEEEEKEDDAEEEEEEEEEKRDVYEPLLSVPSFCLIEDADMDIESD